MEVQGTEARGAVYNGGRDRCGNGAVQGGGFHACSVGRDGDWASQVRPMSICFTPTTKACLVVCEKGEIPTKAKHMAVRYFFVSEKIQEKVVRMFYCPTCRRG